MTSQTRKNSFLVKKKRSVRTTMLHVMVALIPGTLLYAVFIDLRILVNLFVAGTVALCFEYACLRLRSRPTFSTLSDGSILLAAWLLVLCLPPSLPVWQIMMGSAVLATLGKHVFGGLGQNPFNPAMVAYAFMLVSFPVSMTSWELQSHAVTQHTLTIASTSDSTWDGVTGATALDRLKELKRHSSSDNSTGEIAKSYELQQPRANDTQLVRYEVASDWIMGSAWGWTSVAWLLGGIYLLMIRIITWHLPATFLLAISSCYALASLIDSGMALPVVPALLSGGIMLGAFFVITDPVSAAVSRQGQMIYGFGIGILTFIIREFSVYPEGVAFAVLLMNMCVPLIDYISTGKQGTVTLGNRTK